MAPMEILAILWWKSWSISVINFNVQWRVWNVEDTSPFIGAMGANDTTGANEAIRANFSNGIISTIADTIVAIGTIDAIGFLSTLPP